MFQSFDHRNRHVQNDQLNGLPHGDPSLPAYSFFESAIHTDALRADIRELVKKLLDGSAASLSDSIQFHLIAHGDGAVPHAYRQALFLELRDLNEQALITAKIDREPSALMRFLISNERIALRYPHNQTTDADDAAWAELIGQHLSLLSLSKTWDGNHSKHLDYTATLIQGILFCQSHPITVEPERAQLMRNTLSHLIGDAPGLILTHDPSIEAVEDVRTLVRLAEAWNSAECRDALENLFHAVNSLCQEFDPHRFSTPQFIDSEGGTELWLERDDGEFGDEEAECHFYEELSDQRHEKELEGRYVRRIPGDELILFTPDISDHLALLHKEILLTLRKIPFADRNKAALFFLDVLRDNCHMMPDWGDALDGLICVSPFRIRQFMPQLISLAINDSYAVRHVLDLMTSKDRLGDECPADISSDVIDAINRLQRKFQTMIIENGKELFEYDFEVIPHSDRNQKQLEILAERIHHPLSNRRDAT